MSDAAARLARPALAPVVDELARRYAAGSVPVRLTLRDAPVATRRAIADLLGLDRLPGPTVRLAVDRLGASLGTGSGAALRSAVEGLRGPLPDRRAERSTELASREELWSWLSRAAASIDLGTGRDRLGGWVAAQRAAGVRGDVPATRHRLERALRALAALPAEGVSLAGFADDLLDDPHALDHGRPLATVMLDAIACALQQPRAGTAEEARALWEAAGVVPDPLSSAVLALGVPAVGDTPLARWLADARAAGEPVVITLAALRRWPVPPLPAGTVLYVVENPSVLSAAAGSRWAGPPIVCSSGRPSVATVTLLRQLTASGARACQHADFDPAGLSITGWLTRQAGTVPWRMSSSDYLAHVGRAEPFGDVVLADTPWDPSLRDAMQRRGRPVYEERVRAHLLDAMREGGRP